MSANATNFDRKSGVAQWRDLCVDAPSWKCFSTERSAVERPAVPPCRLARGLDLRNKTYRAYRAYRAHICGIPLAAFVVRNAA